MFDFLCSVSSRKALHIIGGVMLLTALQYFIVQLDKKVYENYGWSANFRNLLWVILGASLYFKYADA